MKALLVLTLLIPALSFADEYRHLISFGTNGFGWSGAAEIMETNSRESPFSDVQYFTNNISLNYGYRIHKRVAVGGFFSTAHTEHRFRTGSKTGKVETETDIVGGFLLYHFSDTIASAWYAGLSVSSFTIEEETSHNAAIAESKTPFELDDAGMMYEIVTGKRFRLLRWNIDHLTYAPQIGIFARTHGKDFDDQDVKDGFGVSFQPVRFDLLF